VLIQDSKRIQARFVVDRSAKPTLLASGTIVVHALIAIGHGVAHHDLGVELTVFQFLYVAVVVGLAPMVALGLLCSRRAPLGLLLLGGSMAAALVFGAYWHYLAPSPDNVSQLPAGPSQPLFRTTAHLLVVSEAVAIGLALWALSHRRRTAG
jgi:hypothetical protein